MFWLRDDGIRPNPAMDQTRHPAVRSRAFHLVEVILVIAIISVFAAIAVPRYARSLQRYGVDAAAARIVSDLGLAQARANNTSSTQTVSFLVSSSQYQILGMPDPDHASGTYTVSLPATYHGATLVSVDFAGQQQISFDGFGTPNRGGTVVVGIGDRQRTVVVDGSSGNAVIQ